MTPFWPVLLISQYLLISAAMDRYHRQMLLPFIGQSGQLKLAGSRALLVGCGALGCLIAEQLVRAGVGHLILVDRDVVELTNLQRQVLFDENDAREGMPKAVAAAKRLLAINSGVKIEPHVADVHAGNIESFNSDGVDLVMDGTDNVETRYLLNDVAVKNKIPWVYGACVGTEGRVMTIRPGVTACLQCIFPQPPGVGELQTCDTAGVLGPAIAVVAGYQAASALKILTGHAEATDAGLLTIDFWNNRQRAIDTGGPRVGCDCCNLQVFRFLNRRMESAAATLCGRNSVQVRPAMPTQIHLRDLADRLAAVGSVELSPYLLRLSVRDPEGIVLTVFPDGRCIVQGTSDVARARLLISQFVGS
jgi:molybdopterin/thiamine biosynthesis adenylyltransferase